MLVSHAMKCVESSRNAPACPRASRDRGQELRVPRTRPKGCKTSLVFCQSFAVLQVESSDEKALTGLHPFKAELLLSVQELWDTAALHLLGGKMLCGEARAWVLAASSAPGTARSGTQTAGRRSYLRNLTVAPQLGFLFLFCILLSSRGFLHQ